MQRALLLVPLLALAARGGCTRHDDRRRSAPLPSASATVASHWSPAPFEVVDVLDFGRRGVSRFAYCQATQEVFVSFDRNRHEPVSLEQWSVTGAKRVFAYPIERGWMVDDLHPSPDGRHLVVGLYQHGERVGDHWARYSLVDLGKHAFVALDLAPRNDRFSTVDFGAGGARFRISTTDPVRHFVYDMAGNTAAADPSEFSPRKKGKLWVIASSKGTVNTHGLYYTDEDGKDHLVTQSHWHDNYGLTNDGRFAVTTTWDGEILAWSTQEKREVFRKKIAEQYGYLAHDEANDRFLIADAVYSGSTHLRALVRTRR